MHLFCRRQFFSIKFYPKALYRKKKSEYWRDRRLCFVTYRFFCALACEDVKLAFERAEHYQKAQSDRDQRTLGVQPVAAKSMRLSRSPGVSIGVIRIDRAQARKHAAADPLEEYAAVHVAPALAIMRTPPRSRKTACLLEWKPPRI